MDLDELKAEFDNYCYHTDCKTCDYRNADSCIYAYFDDLYNIDADVFLDYDLYYDDDIYEDLDEW